MHIFTCGCEQPGHHVRQLQELSALSIKPQKQGVTIVPGTFQGTRGHFRSTGLPQWTEQTGNWGKFPACHHTGVHLKQIFPTVDKNLMQYTTSYQITLELTGSLRSWRSFIQCWNSGALYGETAVESLSQQFRIGTPCGPHMGLKKVQTVMEKSPDGLSCNCQWHSYCWMWA